jgi:hypothetical protein
MRAFFDEIFDLPARPKGSGMTGQSGA